MKQTTTTMYLQDSLDKQKQTTRSNQRLSQEVLHKLRLIEQAFK